MAIRWWLVMLGLVVGCSHRIDIGSGERDAGVGDVDLFGEAKPADAAIPAGDGTAGCGLMPPCADGQRCHEGLCLPDNGECQSDDGCRNDSWCACADGSDGGACARGVCVPWGNPPRGTFDPDCGGPGFKVEDFRAPVVKCRWTDKVGGDDVMNTPLVADLDGDKVPELIFGPAARGNTGQRIVALSSQDCRVLFDVNPKLSISSTLTVADLDGDKVPEILGVDLTKHVVVFDNKGVKLAISDVAYMWTGDRNADSAGSAVADLDGVFPPEIVHAGQVLRYRKGAPKLEVLWTKAPHAGTWGVLSAVADLDGDGKPEVIAGTEIYDGLTGADKTPSALADLAWNLGSYPAIADFNGDKKPDVALVRSAAGKQLVAVLDFANNKMIFGPYGVQSGGWGGPPTVADFDGDGVPDIGMASARSYYAYALKCAAPNKPADCTGAEPGVLWQKATRDLSSGGTGSSVFDFNGDGRAEVVYRDECWLRVYNGPDGKTLFAVNVTSGTALEYPVVADVDADGRADIVVSSDSIPQSCPAAAEPETRAPWVGPTTGLFVFRDPQNRWMPSRPLWNQHTYHITNINDDLTIPAREPPNWLTLNNYRQNVEFVPDGGGGPKPDLTGGAPMEIEQGQRSECDTSWTLRANLCNRGSAPLAAGVKGTFYDADPERQQGNVLCTARSRNALAPGECELVACDWLQPRKGPVDLWFRGDDDGGKGGMAVKECRERNNVLFLPDARCIRLQ